MLSLCADVLSPLQVFAGSLRVSARSFRKLLRQVPIVHPHPRKIMQTNSGTTILILIKDTEKRKSNIFPALLVHLCIKAMRIYFLCTVSSTSLLWYTVAINPYFLNCDVLKRYALAIKGYESIYCLNCNSGAIIILSPVLDLPWIVFTEVDLPYITSWPWVLQ